MKKFRYMKKQYFFLFLLVFITSCGSGGGGSQGSETYSISGAAQKGPYLIKSTVLINELTNDGQGTNNTIVAETSDSLGNFTFQTSKPGPVRIVIDGHHLNELTGSQSSGKLTLHAIYKVAPNNSKKAFVNILTHLISGRVIHLMSNGQDTEEAINTAEAELLSALDILLPTSGISSFTNLNLLESESVNMGNAFLLALSAIVYRDAFNKASLEETSIDAKLAYFLNTFSSDFSTDGDIDNQSLINGLILAESQIDPDLIKNNLEQWSLNFPEIIMDIPDMNFFIDSDNDGTVNIDDDTPYVEIPNTAPVANAGADQDVSEGDEVTLDGSGSSDDDGDNLIYRWFMTGSPEENTATLSDTTVMNPTFMADIQGEYTFELDVFDGRDWSAKDSVTIRANPPITIVAQPITYSVVDSTLTTTWSDTYFSIILIDGARTPLNDVELTIDIMYNEPDISGVAQLYSGDSQSGYTAVNPPITVFTNEVGTYNLRADFSHGDGLVYSGNISVTTAGLPPETISFSVSAN